MKSIDALNLLIRNKSFVENTCVEVIGIDGDRCENYENCVFCWEDAFDKMEDNTGECKCNR